MRGRLVLDLTFVMARMHARASWMTCAPGVAQHDKLACQHEVFLMCGLVGKRTNVQQLTWKMVWSFSFYSLLFSFILFYSLLFSFIFFYSLLFSFILFYSLLFSFILFYSLLFSFILFYSLLFSFILFSSL